MRARACWFSLGQYAWGGPRRVGRAPGVRTAPRRPRFRSRSSWIFAPSKRPQMASGRHEADQVPGHSRTRYSVFSSSDPRTKRLSATASGNVRQQKISSVSRPSSKITRMSSPGFQWPVRGLVRAALLDDSGQTDACCASLVTPTRGPERLEG